MLPKTIPILVSSTVKMELPSELTGQDRLAFFLLLLEKGRTWKRKGIIFLQIWEFIYGKQDFWYDSRNFE